MRDTYSRDGQVLVMTAPAVSKQVRFNGDTLHESSILVPMEVLFKRPLGETHVNSDSSARLIARMLLCSRLDDIDRVRVTINNLPLTVDLMH
jgi:hypothetical protein